MIPPAWDNVLLARYSDFGEYKATLGPSSIIRLANGRHYSFVNSKVNDLRIISWPILNNLKFAPKDAIIEYPIERFIEKSFTVGVTGVYGFVLGNALPINVLYDCIITFDVDTNCENQTNIQRFCMRSRAIGTNLFEIHSKSDKIVILLTTESEKYEIKRKYAGVNIDGNLVESSTCVPVDNNIVVAKFVSNDA